MKAALFALARGKIYYLWNYGSVVLFRRYTLKVL